MSRLAPVALVACVALLATPLLGGCSSCTPSPTSPDGGADASIDAPADVTAPDASDAADVADAAEPDACERACRRLAALHCAEAEPTEDGESCVDICRNMESSDEVSFNPECVAKATQCTAVDDCARSELP